MGWRYMGKNQRGDTIVEVLIAIVVVASVLAGAFVVSNTSARNVRKSQEHAEALQILQGQIEQYREFSSRTSSVADARMTSGGCIVSGSPAPTGSCRFGDDSRYVVDLRTTVEDPSNGLITVVGTVTWEQLGGGMASETIVYRSVVQR